MSWERRKHPRYNLRRELTVIVTNERLSASTVDVSRTGVRLDMNRAPRTGDIIELMVAEAEATLFGSARVCHVTHYDAGVWVGAEWLPQSSRVESPARLVTALR